MSGIFLNYRREDTAANAGRLYDRLREHFGGDRIYMDVDTIEPGEDFVETINAKVGVCDVLIALIGPDWLTVKDSRGGRRLDSPDDFVRVEIAVALRRKIRVIPALVGGARVPSAEELPEELVPIIRRQAIELSDTRFHSDVDLLIESLEKTVPRVPAGLTPEVETSQRAPISDTPPPEPSAAETGSTTSKPSGPFVLRNLMWPALGALAGLVLVLILYRSPSDEPPATQTSTQRGAATQVPAGNLPRRLPAVGDARVGEDIYKILSTDLDRHSEGRLSLKFTVRFTHMGRYPANFWGRKFRLFADDVPLAPTEAPNETVDGHSAKEGEVTFVLPASAQKVELQVGEIGHETTKIPIDLRTR